MTITSPSIPVPGREANTSFGLPVLIGLGGRLRSGKDALADHLVAEHGFVKIGFSDPLNLALQVLNPLIPLDFDVHRTDGSLLGRQNTLVRYSDLAQTVDYADAKRHREVRELLQRLGTEVGRNMIDENVWVNVAVNTIKNYRNAGTPVVLTGLRFVNEVQAVRGLVGARTVWVDRPGLGEGTTSAHASENSISAEDFDQVVVNDGTLDDLYAKADALVESLRL